MHHHADLQIQRADPFPVCCRYCLIGIILAFWGLHFAWLLLARLAPNHWAGGYRKLPHSDRVILVIHSAFVLVLTLQLIPYTWLVRHLAECAVG